MKKVLAAVAVVAVVVVAGVVAWITLAGDDEATAQGVCGPVTSWELSSEDEDGMREVAFELLSAGPDETWTVEVVQGDQVVYEGERQTDEDAEIDLDVRADAAGASDFAVTATPESGEECVATLTR